MKKIIFVAALAVLGFTSQAQVTFGAKAGVNISSWRGDDVEGFSSLTGFNAGGLVNIPVSTNFSVQPEVMFSSEGAKFDEVTYSTAYVNVPVLLQFNSNGFIAETGPQLGLLVSAKGKVSGEPSVDLKESFKSTNLSWVVGLGYKLANGLGFNARYNLGLANIVDEDEADVKTGVFAIGAFFTFGGTKSQD